MVPLTILVHPVEDDRWWVQPPPAPTKSDGTWTTRAWFGTETQGIGEDFEILAVATGRRLKQGETIGLGDLPRDMARSEVVMVTRSR
jgi:hypothetical protein